MDKFLIISIVFVISVFYLTMLKNTVVGISTKKSNYIGLGFFLEVFGFIFPGIILITFFGPEHFWALFKIKSSESSLASFLLLFQILVLFITFLILSNTIFKKYVIFRPLYLTDEKLLHVNYLAKAVFLSLLMFNAGVFFVYGYKHALISAFFSGDSLSLLRYDNVDGKMPTFFVYFFFVNSYLLSSLSAFHTRGKRIFYFISALYFCSISGQKMPVANVVLIFIFSYMVINNSKINFSFIIKMTLIPVVMIFFLFYFVKLQYQHYNFELFVDYFYNRVGVGFVAGYYEQFSLKLNDLNYFWHSVPFSNQFQTNPNFHKDLMMISENRSDPNTIGIKNTFFLAEAYAIGGAFLFIISPVIYAFNYLMSFVFLVFYTKKIALLHNDLSQVCIGFVFVFFINLTGGMSDILFYKSPILIAIFISLPLFLVFIWTRFFKRFLF